MARYMVIFEVKGQIEDAKDVGTVEVPIKCKASNLHARIQERKEFLEWEWLKRLAEVAKRKLYADYVLWEDKREVMFLGSDVEVLCDVNVKQIVTIELD